MIFRIFKPVAVILTLAMAHYAMAEPANKAVTERLKEKLRNPAMGLEVDSVSTSELPGLFAVQFVNGPMVYATEQGDYFLLGDLYNVAPEGFVNLTEQSRDAQRLEALAAISTDDMIVFSPEGEPRGHITVFTDITCFYCQKLHLEVPELNAAGVEVRYLAYPRAGVNSDGYRMLATAWCADNPNDTLTKLKAKESLPVKVCQENPVAAQFELGQKLGVRGTPAIITQDGQMVPGYKEADALLADMGLK
ncbi:MAG: DsbC family protein [Pseudomonadota bacterium]